MWQVVLGPVAEREAMAMIPPDYAPLPLEFLPLNATVDPKNPPVLVGWDMQVALVGNNRNSQVRVILNYRPLGVNEWLEQHPNKGVLYIDGAMRFKKVQHLQTERTGLDRNSDHVLNAPDYVFRENPFDQYQADWIGEESDSEHRYWTAPIEGIDSKGYKWEITKGTNVTTECFPVYSIFAVLTNDKMNDYFYPMLSAVGSYNATVMDKFPTWPDYNRVGDFLLSRMNRRPRPGVRGLWNCTFEFIRNKNGWNEPCISSERQLVIEAQDVTKKVEEEDEDGNLTGKIIDEPTGEREIVYRWEPTDGERRFQMIEANDLRTATLLLEDSWEESLL